jgi:hypothetical protein
MSHGHFRVYIGVIIVFGYLKTALQHMTSRSDKSKEKNHGNSVRNRNISKKSFPGTYLFLVWFFFLYSFFYLRSAKENYHLHGYRPFFASLDAIPFTHVRPRGMTSHVFPATDIHVYVYITERYRTIQSVLSGPSITFHHTINNTFLPQPRKIPRRRSWHEVTATMCHANVPGSKYSERSMDP